MIAGYTVQSVQLGALAAPSRFEMDGRRSERAEVEVGKLRYDRKVQLIYSSKSHQTLSICSIGRLELRRIANVSALMVQVHYMAVDCCLFTSVPCTFEKGQNAEFQSRSRRRSL